MKEEKIKYIFFFMAAMCFLFVSILYFFDNEIKRAIPFLLLSFAFSLLSYTHLKKAKNQ